ncbi:TPA: hypothetical protein ACSPZQ_001000 [Aeromonas veronii]
MADFTPDVIQQRDLFAGKPQGTHSNALVQVIGVNGMVAPPQNGI